jgi:hypothetical protein
MINLAQYYGDKFFNHNKAYSKAWYIPIVSGVIWDLLCIFAIIKFFDIQWEYSYFKVAGIFLAYSLLRCGFVAIFKQINYRLNVKNTVINEVKHYLRVFDMSLNDDNSGCVEDYLLAAAFDKSLGDKINILAAMNYTHVICLMSVDSAWDKYYYKAWLDIMSETHGCAGDDPLS